jgi:hypothetical protein
MRTDAAGGGGVSVPASRRTTAPPLARADAPLPGQAWKRCPIHDIYLSRSLGKNGDYLYCPVRTCPNYGVQYRPPAWDGENKTPDPETMWMDRYRRYLGIDTILTKYLRAELNRLERMLWGWDEVHHERMMNRTLTTREHHRGELEGKDCDPDYAVRRLWQDAYTKRAYIKEELKRRARKGER